MVTYSSDAILNQALGSLGQGLGSILGGLQRRRQGQSARSTISNILSQGQLDQSILGQVLSEPGGLEILQQLSPLISPVFKEQARSQGAQGWLENRFGRTSSPIEQVRDSTNENMMGIEGPPPLEDSNRIGPQEQTIYEQGGQKGMGLNPPEEEVQQSGFDITKLSDNDLVQLSGAPYQEFRDMASAEQKRRNLESKRSERREERDFQETKPYREKLTNFRSSLPDLETALFRIGDALDSKDLKSFQNWIADRLNDDYLRTSSAAALNSAVKEFLLSDLGRIKGGRPNQFLEKQLSQAYTQAGYDGKANDKIFQAMKSGVEIKRKELELADELRERFEQQGKPLPGNFEQLVYKKLRPYVEEQEQNLIREYKAINQGKGIVSSRFKQKTPKGRVPMIGPSGERVYILEDQVDLATNQGYKGL